MTWNIVPTRTEDTSSFFNDINQLQEQILLLGGNGYLQPSTNIESLSDDLAVVEADIATLQTQISAVDSSFVEKSQTVLFAKCDSDGYADFLSEDTADAITLLADTEECVITFADGGSNYILTITADQSPVNWEGLTGVGTWFLYAEGEVDTNSNGVFTLSELNKTRVRPQYGQAFDITKNALLHFDGADTSTTMTDEYGNVWSAEGNAKISTGDKKFGSASLELDGAGDYVSNTTILSLGDKFCIEFWFHTDNTATANQTLFMFGNAAGYGLQLSFNVAASGKMRYYISTTGAAYNIAQANGTKAAWNADQWYHVRCEWDGANFYAYIDGVQDYTVAMTDPINALTRVYIGANPTPANFLDGGIDEFRMDIGYTREEEAFTPAVAAYSPDAQFFDISTMKMYEGCPSSWTEKKRVFLGEALMVANHVDSVVPYALRGRYQTEYAVAAANSYSKNHNVGCDQVKSKLEYRLHDGWYWEDVTSLQDTGGNWYGATWSLKYKSAKIRTASTYSNTPLSASVDSTPAGNQNAGFHRLTVERSF